MKTLYVCNFHLIGNTHYIYRKVATALQETDSPLQDMDGDAYGDPLGGSLDRVVRNVRIARGGLDPAVTAQPSDHWPGLSERQLSAS